MYSGVTKCLVPSSSQKEYYQVWPVIYIWTCKVCGLLLWLVRGSSMYLLHDWQEICTGVQCGSVALIFYIFIIITASLWTCHFHTCYPLLHLQVLQMMELGAAPLWSQAHMQGVGFSEWELYNPYWLGRSSYHSVNYPYQKYGWYAVDILVSGGSYLILTWHSTIYA